MPQTLNGIGTKYYGKANAVSERAVCDSCGREGIQESYDTNRYFVLVFIPLLPLGKYRILDDVPFFGGGEYWYV